MGDAELRFDEMVDELKEINRLLGRLVKLLQQVDQNVRFTRGDLEAKQLTDRSRLR